MLGRYTLRGIKAIKRRTILLAQQGTVLLTPHALRLTSPPGFTLVELIGVLAILAILASFITPNVINQLRSTRRDAEDQQLANIAQGIELYIRQTRSLPTNLAALSPDYVPVSSGQLTNNANGFLRYYFMQPNISGYNNATGITPSTLADSRFLLITNLTQNVNPTITTDAEFETWWNTDETGTPDLKIHRGQFGQLLHLLSLSADGVGGSYAVDGTPTNSGGGILASRTTYHITGSTLALDEASTFGTAETQLTLTTDAGYQFDPDCPSGSQWRVINSGCYAP